MKKRTKLPSWAAIALLAVGALAAIMAFGQTRKEPGIRVAAAIHKPAASAPAAAAPTVGRKQLAYYTGTVRGDLFAPPEAEPPKPVEPPKAPEPPPAPAEIDPFTDYAYTGTVAMGDKTMALVENSKTKEGLYLAAGDSFIGGTIKSISDQSVSVTIAGKERSLYKTQDFKLTPLDKSAAYLTSQPGQPVPGMGGRGMFGGPGGPGGPFGGGPFGGGFGGGMDRQQRMQQWMDRMTPEQRDRIQRRMQNRMNRQFEQQ